MRTRRVALMIQLDVCVRTTPARKFVVVGGGVGWLTPTTYIQLAGAGSIHLLKNLLSKNLGFDRNDIASMQSNCLHLNEIIDRVKSKGNTLFVLKNNILYKQQGEHLLLAIPAVLAKGIIFKLHTVQGFILIVFICKHN